MATTVPISMKSLMPLRKRIEAKDFCTCREARHLVSLCRSTDGNLKGLMKAKVFLRNRGTGQYYTGLTGWSGNGSMAHDFDTVESATLFAKIERFACMEVVLHYDDPVCDLILSLRESA